MVFNLSDWNLFFFLRFRDKIYLFIFFLEKVVSPLPNYQFWKAGSFEIGKYVMRTAWFDPSNPHPIPQEKHPQDFRCLSRLDITWFPDVGVQLQAPEITGTKIALELTRINRECSKKWIQRDFYCVHVEIIFRYVVENMYRSWIFPCILRIMHFFL